MLALNTQMLVWLATMVAVRRALVALGWIAPLLLIGLTIALVCLHQLGFINAWLFPLKQVGIVLIVTSLVCLTTARVLKRVERTRVSNQSAVCSAATSRSGWLKRLLKAFVVVLIALNAIALMGSYYMTHVVEPGSIGIGLPKPQNTVTPGDRGLSYSTERIELGNSAWLEAWKMQSQLPTPRGTALLFQRQFDSNEQLEKGWW